MNLNKLYEKHSTHRYKTKDDKKIVESISEVITPEGICSKDKWIILVNKSIEEKGEAHIFNMLVDYALKECAWITETEDAKRYALNLYSCRIWEDPVWVGYDEFNRDLKNLATVGQLSFI
ncbi:hypothetical protein TPDSL_13880 [Terrisporobacter petrolearius]|uniref:hypothetical protein n=1 Tax=Terrisporobacter petrolearius TaxID=1460447 RepID=UPI00336739C5